MCACAEDSLLIGPDLSFANIVIGLAAGSERVIDEGIVSAVAVRAVVTTTAEGCHTSAAALDDVKRRS